jgi:TetR/AcrR family transcriptional regulator
MCYTYHTFSKYQGVDFLMKDRRPRNKEQTMHDVISAATQLFSEKGLHGTSFREIEKASGVSKGLIIHHFETKENLYAVVQDNLNREYTVWMKAQRATGKTLEDTTITAIQGSLSYLKNHPEFRRITLWSYLEGQDRNTELDKSFISVLIQAMSTGQQGGLIREDVEAFVLPFIIRGAIDYWIRRESLREILWAENQDDKAVSDGEFVNALVRLIFR